MFKICTIFITNEGKNNVLSANKQSNELYTAVSVAFSYLLQYRIKNSEKLLLLIVFQWIKQKGEELRNRPIGKQNKEMHAKSEKKLEESGEIRSNERFLIV